MEEKGLEDRELALGHEGLDREHGLQVQMLEAIEEAVAAGEAPGAVEELLERLRACSDVHFASEELLMRLHRYPRYGMHVEEHRRLLDQLGTLRSGEDPRALVRVVETWIEEHVRGMDRDFVEHVTAGRRR